MYCHILYYVLSYTVFFGTYHFANKNDRAIEILLKCKKNSSRKISRKNNVTLL